MHEGVPWVLMDLIDGRTLREEIATRDVMSVPFACALLRSAAYAAHQCHLIGIIHRDIKPENFMVPRVPRDAPPHVKLIDLGVAHIFKEGDTQGQGPIGTPLYMAPEQFNTRLPVTEATDVYSLGLMAYEMLAGVHPLQQGERELNAWELCFEHSYTSPPPLATFGVAPELSLVVASAMEKHPLRRLASAMDFGDALWAAWKRVRDREPAEDTHAGEPASSIVSVPNVLDARTGPVGIPARRAGTSRPVAHVRSGPLPPEMADPAAVETFLHAQAAAREGPAALAVVESAPPPVAESAPPPVAESAPPPVAESAPPPVAAQAPPRPPPAGASKRPARAPGGGDRRAAGAPPASASAVASASPASSKEPAKRAPPRPF